MNPLNYRNLRELPEQFWNKLIFKPVIKGKTKDSTEPEFDKRHKNIFDRLETVINDPKFSTRCVAEQEFLNDLNNEGRLKEIITGDLNDLKEYAKIGKSLFFKDGKATAFRDEILSIFAYDESRDKFATWLSESLKIKSCPYCNAQHTISAGKNVYHTFDHFFPKAIYPHLSVSFYNLIPACNSCNQLKSSTDVNHDDWHPYSDIDIMSKFHFQIEPDSFIEFKTSKYQDDTVLKIIAQPNSDEMVEKLFKTFKLEERYAFHKDIAAETIWKSEIYTSSYQEDLEKLLNSDKIQLTKSEIKRIIIGNYADPADVHKRPLAKLTSDLAKDLGLI